MEQKDWSGILVVLEYKDHTITDLSKELLYKASALAEGPESVYGVIFLGEEESLEANLFLPAKKIIVYETQKTYECRAYKKLLCDCIDQICPAIVLLGGTPVGKELASRIAVTYKTGVTADCTELEINEEGDFIQTRPAFGGNVMADIVTPVKRPQIATAQKGIFPKDMLCKTKCSYLVKKEVNCFEKNTKIISEEKIKPAISIDEAKVLVAVGRGVKEKKDLKLLETFASLIGGVLACSRAIVEKGWMGPEKQIGLSGQTVQPDVLITFGISGSVQFISGMKNSKCIIAINNDPKAAIFNIADYPILGDIYEIVPKLLEKLEKKHDNQI